MDAHIIQPQAEVTSSEMECIVCLDIGKALTCDEYRTQIVIGTMDDVLGRPCPGHDSLFRFLLSKLPKDKVSPDFQLSIFLGNAPDHGASLQLWGSDTERLRYYSNYELLLVRASGSSPTAGVGRILDTDWVDTGVLREWLSGVWQITTAAAETRLTLPRFHQPG